jgi:hypothetical protein
MSVIARIAVCDGCGREPHNPEIRAGSPCTIPGCGGAFRVYVPESTTPGAVVLSDDERKALAWAARRGAALLRVEGWPDMRQNAEILDAILPRLEGGQ